MKQAMTKDVALLILRLAGLGLAFAHGWGKISALASGEADGFIERVGQLGFPVPVVFAWAAGLAEFVGGLFVAFGLFTRVAASFAAITMLVAGFLRHKFHLHLLVWLGLFDASKESIESWRDPEKSLVYLLIMLALILMGAGRFSLDSIVRKKS
jgi:putative oxidoreductase